MNKILDAQEIPGFTFYHQHQHYKKIVDKLPEAPRICEIGCLYGKSTWGWLDAIPPTGRLTVVDYFWSPSLQQSKFLHEKDPKSMDYCYDAVDNGWLSTNWKKVCNLSQFNLFNHIINQHPKSNQIKEVHQIKSQNYRKSNMSKDFDCVYLDDDHTYQNVLEWLHYFDDVPLVCGDDVGMEEVRSALYDYHRKRGGNARVQILSGNFWYIEKT